MARSLRHVSFSRIRNEIIDKAVPMQREVSARAFPYPFPYFYLPRSLYIHGRRQLCGCDYHGSQMPHRS